MHTDRVTTDVPTPDHRALGASLRRRREHLRMRRQDVTDAGGPSTATIQRIENGEIKTEIDAATKQRLEESLRLPRGSIDDHLAGRITEFDGEQDPVILEGSGGERLLVGILNGLPKLSPTELDAVLAVVRALRYESDT
jgi:hypothetical protein